MISGALVMREFETARIGTSWDPAMKTVSRREIALLDLHQRSINKKLFDLSYRTIKATNWVGVIGLGERCIEVVPKIDEPNELKVRENLLYMITRAGIVPLSVADIARLASSNKPLLIAYMELYVDQLAREWRKGQIKRYIPFEENRMCLKGKLVLPAHLRTNLLHQERFFTVADEFTSNNLISQTLKAALLKCKEQAFSSRVSQKAKSLMSDFEEVSDIIPSENEIKQIQVDRPISRFEPLVNMAKFILRDISPSPAVSGHSVYSLMFDMNEVFERFIAAEIKAAFISESWRVRYPVAGKSLLRRNGKRKFALRPDIGVHLGGKYLCIVDTKWKRLDRNRPYDNVSQADIYQMYAYGKEYEIPKVILLYPQHSDLPLEVAEYEHIENAPEKRILICTINISEPLSLRTTRSRLHRKLREIVL